MKILHSLFFVFILALLTSCGEPKSKDPKIAQARQELLNQVKQEKMVSDAVITDANILYIAVPDDGTSRKGLAEYFCSMAQTSELYSIKIVASGSAQAKNKQTAYGNVIGMSQCNF